MAGNWFDEQDKHRRSRPLHDGLARMARAVAPGSRVVRSRRLVGGLGSATTAIDLRKRTGSIVPLVLKRFVPGDMAAKREWTNLRFAERIGVPTPEPVAFDGGGWFGGPAIVMERLPGRADHRPDNLDAWLGQMAAALVEIQSTSMSRLPAAVRAPHFYREWDVPDGLRRTPLVRRVERAVRRTLPHALDTDPVIAHADLHPGNFLWQRGKLSGVIDLSWITVAPASYDVAYMRSDLTVLMGLRAADGFLAHYERLRGAPARDLRPFDLSHGLTSLRWCPYAAIAYEEQGADVDVTRAKERVRRFLERALDR